MQTADKMLIHDQESAVKLQQSKQGLKVLVEFAKRNQLLNESLDVVLDIMVSKEDEVAAEMMSDYWDTLMSAKPNCFD